MTLENVAQLVESMGASSVKTTYGFSASTIYTSLRSDLSFLNSHQSEKKYGIITNYYRRASDHNGGHISPIVAYNEIEDLVLILGLFILFNFLSFIFYFYYFFFFFFFGN